MVDAMEVYYVNVSRWSGDEYEPIRDSKLGQKYFRRYKAQREVDRLTEKHQQKPDPKDNVRYFITTELKRKSELPDYLDRPDNFKHIEEVKGFEDTCGIIKELQQSKSMSIAHVKLNGKGKRHIHPEMEEIYYITKGKGYLTLDEKKYEIEEGDSINIPDRSHFIETEETLELIVATSPVFDPNLVQVVETTASSSELHNT